MTATREHLLEVARRAALAAGEAILRVYATAFDVQQKTDNTPVCEGDLASEKATASLPAILSLDAVPVGVMVGRPAEGNEEVVAFVQLLKGSKTSPQDLMAYIAPQLTSYKRPSEIIVLDALPATSTGKILKHKLAESLRSVAGKSHREFQ